MSVYHEPDLNCRWNRTAMITVAGLILTASVLACLCLPSQPTNQPVAVSATVTEINSRAADMYGRR